MSKATLYIVSAMVMILASGCITNIERADQFVAPEAQFVKAGAAHTALMYVPNRIADLVDIIHLGVGVGPGVGLELQLTRPLRIGASAAVNVGVAWLGRDTSPLQSGIYARAFVGALEANAHVAENPTVWRAPKWDIGVLYNDLFAVAYVGVVLDELCDFVTGLVCYDLKDDDF